MKRFAFVLILAMTTWSVASNPVNGDVNRDVPNAGTNPESSRVAMLAFIDGETDAVDVAIDLSLLSQDEAGAFLARQQEIVSKSATGWNYLGAYSSYSSVAPALNSAGLAPENVKMTSINISSGLYLIYVFYYVP